MWGIVDHDLDTEWHLGPPPDATWADYSWQVLKSTLLQRSGGDEYHPAIVKVRKFVNGNWLLPTLQHYCNGCCASRYESKLNVFAALVEIDILLGNVVRNPSLDDWRSFGESGSKASVSIMCCRVGPRVVERTFPDWHSTDLEGADDDGERPVAEEARAMLRKKVWRTKKVMGSPERLFEITLLVVQGARLERLMLDLDSLDEGRNGLLDVLLDRTNPFYKCARDLVSVLGGGDWCRSPLIVLLLRFEGELSQEELASKYVVNLFRQPFRGGLSLQTCYLLTHVECKESGHIRRVS